MLNFGAAKKEETKETLAVCITCVECVCVYVCVCRSAQCQLQSEDKSRLSPDP